MNVNALSAFFNPEDIGWKPIAVSKRTQKALAAAYVTNRAIMDRLDAVCGPANWRNEFQPGPGGGVVCGISIRIAREDGSFEWVTKWDGADNTDIHPIKGGLSSSMRRAAVQWGIGRYLYSLPQVWAAVDEHGRFKQPPQMPRAFLPTASTGASTSPSATSQEVRTSEDPRSSRSSPSVRNEVDAYRMPNGVKG